MRSRRNIVIGAGLLLFAAVLALAAPAAQRSDTAPAREPSSHAAVAAVAGTAPATLAAITPSHRILSGTFVACVIAALSLALVRTGRARRSLSSRALIVRAGLGRRGRAPPLVCS